MDPLTYCEDFLLPEHLAFGEDPNLRFRWSALLPDLADILQPFIRANVLEDHELTLLDKINHIMRGLALLVDEFSKLVVHRLEGEQQNQKQLSREQMEPRVFRQLLDVFLHLALLRLEQDVLVVVFSEHCKQTVRLAHDCRQTRRIVDHGQLTKGISPFKLIDLQQAIQALLKGE